MKKILLILICLCLIGAAPTRTKTYTSGTTITSADVTENEDNIFTYLQGGVDTIKVSSITSSHIVDGAIVGGDINGSAAIAASKLNLSNIATDVIISGTTPLLTIGDGGAEDAQVNINGSAQDWHIGIDDTDDDFKIGLGTALGTTDHIVIDETGAVTKPLNPAFLAQPTSDQLNLAAGSSTDIVFATERFDTNGDFATPSFTAPVTGKYLLTVHLRFAALDTASTYYLINLVTSNRTYQHVFTSNQFAADVDHWAFTTSIVADMDVTDTAKIQVNPEGSGANQADIDTDSYFSASLLN